MPAGVYAKMYFERLGLWQRLAPKLKAAQLHRVRVYETPDLFVDFYGEA